jgi:hypothetical protein
MPPNSLPTGVPGGATFISVIYGTLQRETTPRCNDRGIQGVYLRPNPFFDMVSAVTVGLVSPTRVGWSCVAAAGGAP